MKHRGPYDKEGDNSDERICDSVPERGQQDFLMSSPSTQHTKAG